MISLDGGFLSCRPVGWGQNAKLVLGTRGKENLELPQQKTVRSNCGKSLCVCVSRPRIGGSSIANYPILPADFCKSVCENQLGVVCDTAGLGRNTLSQFQRKWQWNIYSKERNWEINSLMMEQGGYFPRSWKLAFLLLPTPRFKYADWDYCNSLFSCHGNNS